MLTILTDTGGNKPANCPLMKTCKEWPADMTVKEGYFPFTRNCSLLSIFTLQHQKEKDKKVVRLTNQNRY